MTEIQIRSLYTLEQSNGRCKALSAGESHAETDPMSIVYRKEAADAAIAFFNVYRERSKPVGTLPIFHVLDKHNHLRFVQKRPI